MLTSPGEVQQRVYKNKLNPEREHISFPHSYSSVIKMQEKIFTSQEY